MKNLLKEKKAITLIALVITIVVLIVLAGVLINISLGNNGLFNKAKTAKEMYTNAQDYEEAEIAKVSNEVDSYISGGARDETIATLLSRIQQLESAIQNIQKPEIDYANKVEISAYSSSTNQYTTLSSGFIIIPSFAVKDGGGFNLYIDNQRVIWDVNSDSNWMRIGECIPVAKNSKVYYSFSGTMLFGNENNDENIYFVPYK